MMTGRILNLSKMWIFGSDCYAYKHNQRKLDPRCEKGIFAGDDKNSPAYLIYYPVSGKVMKHRLVKFIRKGSVAQQTQTDETWFDEADMYLKQNTCEKTNTGEASIPKGQTEMDNPQDEIGPVEGFENQIETGVGIGNITTENDIGRSK
ncbi:hypothetical protein HOLleu_09419 [Holothuria leucospilota]|uniref:Retroviral polymerase SH3-like domain-containing protein n=1 Tax=Holothuria leucospilota TaxID=206669 RepID=A0A9Q1CDE4_HOLLE|nr:hypothetical protein HOLleu_09419 [Holothuria leucospilota]